MALITLGLALGVMPVHYNGVYEPSREHTSRPFHEGQRSGGSGLACRGTIIGNGSRLHFLSSQGKNSSRRCPTFSRSGIEHRQDRRCMNLSLPSLYARLSLFSNASSGTKQGRLWAVLLWLACSEQIKVRREAMRSMFMTSTTHLG